ncbi:leucine-rich repeat protein [bacterium]|nr:leucine-rich repeat protein [bacterium]
MKKKYINLIILASSLSIATIVGANVAMFVNKNNAKNAHNINTNKTISNLKYYNANGFLLSVTNNSVTIDNITYSLNETQNTASVINVKNGISTLIIPSAIEYDGNYYNVTSIASGACYNKQITKLVLSNNIISIGSDAFANNLLTNITLPPYLQSLGNNAFNNNPFEQGTVINLPSNCS